MGKCQHPQTTTTVYKKMDGKAEYNEIRTVCIRCFRAINVTNDKKD